MNDFRSEITAGLVQKLRNTTLSGSYVYSVENDYQSHNVDLGLSQDLFEKNSTLAIGATFSANDVYRTGDQLFHRKLARRRRVGVVDAGARPRHHRAALVHVLLRQRLLGEPVPLRAVETPDLSAIEFKVPETEPNERFRHAAVIGLNRHLFSDTSLQGDYRFYADNWGVLSHTIQLRYFVTWKDVTLRLRERFYYQTGASFFRPHYTAATLQPFVTADRELSTFWSNVAGFKVSWRLPWVHRALELEAKVDYFHFGYVNFALLAHRATAPTSRRGSMSSTNRCHCARRSSLAVDGARRRHRAHGDAARRLRRRRRQVRQGARERARRALRAHPRRALQADRRASSAIAAPRPTTCTAVARAIGADADHRRRRRRQGAQPRAAHRRARRRHRPRHLARPLRPHGPHAAARQRARRRRPRARARARAPRRRSGARPADDADRGRAGGDARRSARRRCAAAAHRGRLAGRRQRRDARAQRRRAARSPACRPPSARRCSRARSASTSPRRRATPAAPSPASAPTAPSSRWRSRRELAAEHPVLASFGFVGSYEYVFDFTSTTGGGQLARPARRAGTCSSSGACRSATTPRGGVLTLDTGLQQMSWSHAAPVDVGVPDVQYDLVGGGLGWERALGTRWIILGLRLGVMGLLSAGDIAAQTQYGSVGGWGLQLAGGWTARPADWFWLRLTASWDRIALSFARRRHALRQIGHRQLGRRRAGGGLCALARGYSLVLLLSLGVGGARLRRRVAVLRRRRRTRRPSARSAEGLYFTGAPRFASLDCSTCHTAGRSTSACVSTPTIRRCSTSAISRARPTSCRSI